MPAGSTCRICSGTLREFIDFGRQPLSNRFVRPEDIEGETFFRLATGICESCTMVQLMEEVPRELMFNEDYPYVSAGSSVMREHFASIARRFLNTHLKGEDTFAIELGSNDGTMLRTIADAGVRHLGVDPSGGVGETAREQGVRVLVDFFEKESAERIMAEDGPANVIYAANTLCHIPYLDSVFQGIALLLAKDGVFVFEDPYFGDVLRRNSFDQIYDEHYYYFTARSVQALAARYGLELVEVERLPVHGGEVRYTLAHAGARTPSLAVSELISEEDASGVAKLETLEAFSAKVDAIRDDLVGLLKDLKEQGKTVVAYGATAKSATVANYFGIGPDLVEFVCDTTPAKQGRLTPGMHIPVRPAQAFTDPYPDYALLFAWNHAEEIMAKEEGFRASGGRWIRYVPDVTVS
ncbi:MAG TPA: class I SAM-dependent methyltransferase [Nocardiopsis listeri]|uniref:class I SAM-dependent methyltransferase n=1 Tax=Nocardiopsis listeri TaxID=53440 RepID=UPI001E17B7D0|nr:class I SAM-dependent methyltransferase [Nocardiopsis listeri]HJE57223.1 class I SAM-dependent methyltransferase [Nocardiopsis listeri]